MTEGSITLSHAELDRVSVIRSIISRQLTPAQAAPRLQLSIRQVQRLTRAHRTCGATRMASTHRGRAPGNAIGDEVRPPAKGRVERAHKTRQDRLVKELRLLSIGSIEPANALLTPPAVIPTCFDPDGGWSKTR